jgi:hypothetical protein
MPSPTRLAALLATLATACSSGGGDTPSPRTDRVTVRVEALQSVTLSAGVPTRITWVQATPPTPVLGFEVDLLATLGQVQVSPRTLLRALGAAAAGDPALVTVRVAPADQLETVCTTGVGYGPFQIGLDALLAPVTAAPATATAGGSTLAIVNSGPYVTCLEITSPVDAAFGLSGTEVVLTQDCAPPAADFSGSWTGTWSCGSSCGSSFGGDITLTVTQDPDGRARYVDDSLDEYAGSVCGAEFRFVRNIAFETERGTMTLGAGGTARKRSHYRGSAPPYCAGDCVDELHRP